MKMHKKIISVILIVGLVIGCISVNSVEAKMVEGKTKSGNSELKISLLNEKLDYNLKEVAFKIKNKAEKKVKVTRVKIQFKSKGEWTTLKTQKKSVTKRKTVISAGNTVYDSVNLNTDYVISTEGLPDGKYAIYIKYKYEGKSYFRRKSFFIEGNEKTDVNKEETTAIEEITTGEDITILPEDETTSGGEPSTEKPGFIPKPDVTISEATTKKEPSAVSDSSTQTDNAVSKSETANIKIKLINTDFIIGKNGKATAMVFSEADYKKARKAKIYVSIQRKTKGKWKKYKSYKVVKKSNIAFINKQLKIKKKGTYRMWVKVTFYGKGKKRKQYKTKSKTQNF